MWPTDRYENIQFYICKNALPKGIEVTRNVALGYCIVHDSHNYSEYSYGIASNNGMILPCIYEIPYSIYDGKAYIVEKSWKTEEKGLFNLINKRLLVPCEIWTSEPFINSRYVKCQIDIKYEFADTVEEAAVEFVPAE